jgi:hypothetical protein
MKTTQLAQLGSVLMAVVTPWIVIQVARAVALRHAPAAAVLAVAPGQRRVLLGRATAAAASIVACFALLLPWRPTWLAALGLAAFAGLSAMALRALGELDRGTRAARQVDTPTRTASLVARRHRHYLSRSLRTLPFGLFVIGGALFAWRVTLPTIHDRRLFLPIGFALVASVFLWLYETWIHQLVTGPEAPGAGDASPVEQRRSSIHVVFATELVLVGGFFALAHALLDLNWTANGGWGAFAGVVGGLLGVLGCALALSSDLAVRRYRLIR